MSRPTIWHRGRAWLLAVVVCSLFAGQNVSSVSAQGNGPDVYMKDTPADTGVEPNPDLGPMWVSQDIWVRTTPDPNYDPNPFPEASPTWTPLPHQNPEYRDPQYGLPNYVYVRVRNRGDAASTGTERLRLYWAKAGTGLSWPTQWVDYLALSGANLELFGSEVTKPRKNAATATPAERFAYRQAILAIGTTPAMVFSDGVSYWHKQDEVHEFGPANRHGSPAFLPWHRELLNRYETLLQEADPTVKLMYWDWTTDPENSTGGFNFFTSLFMGASGRGTGGTAIGAPFDPALSPPAVTRNLSTNTTPPADPDATVIGAGPYENFAPDLEQVPNHDSSHGYIGGGGNMSSISRAAEDPFFFLLHTNADRLWAQWQRDPTALSRIEPATAYDADSANANITGNMAPWNGTGTAIEPWTIAGGYIVNKSPLNPSVVFPPIYDTAPLVIPVLQPGEAVVLQIPWYPPNPADFAAFGGQQGHICLLSRIETDPNSPFGMTFPEGADVPTNTRNNNNIAWKNLTVVDNFPGALGFTSILVRNVFSEAVLTGLRFADTDEIGASFFDFGRIYVDLNPELFDRWIEGGAAGRGVEPVGGTTRIQVFGPDAEIGNLRLEPGETFSIDVGFELNKDYRPVRGLIAKWDLIQFGTPNDPRRVVGGQRFEINFEKLVPVKPGAQWRYLSDGSDPGSKWMAEDFDDSKWGLGAAELGFGDNPVTTIDGGPPDKRHITAYFRRAFDVADPSFFRSLLLRLKRDDGAIVYLNGTEVHRVNLPAGAVTPGTLATRDVQGLEEEMFFPVDLSNALPLLHAGRNVIAVEVHQDSPRSPDLSFDLELAANPAVTRFGPDVRLAQPLDGALFQIGSQVPILVEALHTQGKVTSVELFVDGKSTGVDMDPPFAFNLPAASLGSHRLRVVATDEVGLKANDDVTVSVLNNTPPVVTLTAPADGATFHAGETIQISAQATDPGGIVSKVDFYVRDAELFTAPNQLVGSDQTAPYTVDVTGLAPGHYMLNAVATDNGGMTSQGIPIHVEVHMQMGRSLYLPLIHR